MKRVILSLLVIITMVSCVINPSPNEDGRVETSKLGDYKIKVIDGCEYLEYSSGFSLNDNYTYTLTHKGNCKFCIERNKR